MDPDRFDSLAKRLGGRISRRAFVGAAAATMLAVPAVPYRSTVLAQSERTTAIDRYIAVRTFAYDSTREKAEAELPDLVAHMEEQPGFVGIECVWGETEIYLIVTFLDEATSVPGMETIDWWIETHIQSTLYGDFEQSEGKVVLRSFLFAGCPCDLEDDDDPCGSDLLVCCPVSESEGEPGVCLSAETTCPAGGGADDDPSDEELTLSAGDLTPIAGAAVSCTSEGCDCPDGICDAGLACCTSTGTCQYTCPCGYEGCYCVGSVVNTCDDGLICCAPGEIGGEGTCQYSCSCSYEGCSCTTGVDGACDAGLSCCGIFSSDPGNIGACLSSCSNGSTNPCPGADGCECIPGTSWICNAGLVCCGAEAGESGICASSCA
ncbi:MAG: hypothetical protein R2848_13910 [Thermomicrobiales bacterium]